MNMCVPIFQVYLMYVSSGHCDISSILWCIDHFLQSFITTKESVLMYALDLLCLCIKWQARILLTATYLE